MNDYLDVSSGATGSNQIAYLSIDLKALNKVIVDGRLSLTGGANGAAVKIGAYGTNGVPWTASGLTWNHRPQIVGARVDEETVGTDGTYSWNVESLINNAKATGKTSVTIALMCDATSTTGATFASMRASSGTPKENVDAHD